MKIAFCIIAHKYTPVLQTLISQIQGGGNQVILHVDKKSDIDLFSPVLNNVLLTENRIEVTWGTYSQIECMLSLLAQTRTIKCDYISFLSGDTLPLRPWPEIQQFFERFQTQELVDIHPLPKNFEMRVKYYHPEHDVRKQTFISKIIRSLQYRLRFLPKNKLYKRLPPLFFGSNWFAITPCFRDYIFQYLNRNPDYQKAFHKSFCCDELFFHTILAHSPFSKRNHNLCLFYLDWKSGPAFPKIFTTEDMDQIRDNRQNYHLFARKIDDNMDLVLWGELFWK